MQSGTPAKPLDQESSSCISRRRRRWPTAAWSWRLPIHSIMRPCARWASPPACARSRPSRRDRGARRPARAAPREPRSIPKPSAPSIFFEPRQAGAEPSHNPIVKMAALLIEQAGHAARQRHPPRAGRRGPHGTLPHRRQPRGGDAPLPGGAPSAGGAPQGHGPARHRRAPCAAGRRPVAQGRRPAHRLPRRHPADAVRREGRHPYPRPQARSRRVDQLGFEPERAGARPRVPASDRTE